MTYTKLIKIDSQLDTKSNCLFSGKSFERGCHDGHKEVVHFGVRNYANQKAKLTSKHDALVFEPNHCNSDQMTEIKNHVNQYFSQFGNHSQDSKFWISLNPNSIDSSQFKSTEVLEGNGLNLEFLFKLLEVYTPKSIGMDMSEINFALTSGGARQNDEQTFREIFETVCHQINKPSKFDNFKASEQKQYADTRQ